MDWYCSEPRLALNRTVVLRYRSHLESRQLAPGTISPVLAQYDVSHTKRPIAVSSSADLAAGIRRVKGVKKIGVRLGNWLTAEQAVDGDKAFYGALIFVDFQISRPILDITALAMNNRLLQASLSRREIG